jgi:hypothetical protein
MDPALPPDGAEADGLFAVRAVGRGGDRRDPIDSNIW